MYALQKHILGRIFWENNISYRNRPSQKLGGTDSFHPQFRGYMIWCGV